MDGRQAGSPLPAQAAMLLQTHPMGALTGRRGR